MTNFFDYVYFRTCNLYAREQSPALSGVVVLGLLQGFNIFTLFFFSMHSVRQKISYQYNIGNRCLSTVNYFERNKI